MTILAALKSINAYPVPRETLEEIACCRDLELSGELTKTVTKSANYNLARADILRWLSRAPQIGQGGQSYALTDKQREEMGELADRIAKEYGEDEGNAERRVSYGYKGDRL